MRPNILRSQVAFSLNELYLLVFISLVLYTHIFIYRYTLMFIAPRVRRCICLRMQLSVSRALWKISKSCHTYFSCHWIFSLDANAWYTLPKALALTAPLPHRDSNKLASIEHLKKSQKGTDIPEKMWIIYIFNTFESSLGHYYFFFRFSDLAHWISTTNLFPCDRSISQESSNLHPSRTATMDQCRWNLVISLTISKLNFHTEPTTSIQLYR